MFKKIPLLVKENGRTCENCTKCCEGWLTATIDGEPIYPGKPCKAVTEGVGCSIYKDRPKDPCRSFECFWRATDVMPMEFKPSKVGVIVTNQQVEGIPFILLSEAGNRVDAEVLSWFLGWAVSNKFNVQWQVGDVYHQLGSNEFLGAIMKTKDAVYTPKNKEK